MTRHKRNCVAVVAQLQHKWAVLSLDILLRWRGRASSQRRARRGVAALLHRQWMRRLAALHAHWAAWTLRRKERKRAILAGALSHWRAKTGDRRVVAVVLRKAEALWPARAVCAGFAHWKKLFLQKLEMGVLNQAADEWFRTSNLVSYVARWRHRARAYAVMRPAFARIVLPVSADTNGCLLCVCLCVCRYVSGCECS